MTDTSISDIERISYKEIDLKIGRLDHYINKVHQRINAINNFASNATEHLKKRGKIIEPEDKNVSIKEKR